jgi:hypothetical protein
MELETVQIQLQADLKVLGPLPVTWSHYFENLFGFEWELTKSSWSTPFKPLAMLVLEPFLMRMTQRKHINLSCW